MKLRSMHGLAVTGAAVALLAGCTGGRGEEPRSAPAPAAPATSAPSAEPTPGAAAEGEPVGSTATTQRPAPPKPARPVIGKVWPTPELTCDSSFCTVVGAGTVDFHARVSGATSVGFALVSTGTGPDRARRDLGVDRNGRDGWSVRWAYPDEPLLSHLVVTARGPGGTTEATPFGIHHPDPA